MTKMASTPIYGGTTFRVPKVFNTILKLGMHHWGLKLYKFYINDDLGLTLDLFTAKSKLVAYAFEWGITVTMSFNGKKIAANDQSDRR